MLFRSGLMPRSARLNLALVGIRRAISSDPVCQKYLVRLCRNNMPLLSLTRPNQRRSLLPPRDIIGKKDVDGEVYYLVDLRPTLVPEQALGKAKELIDEFKVRLRAQLESKSRRGRPGLTRGEQAVLVADVPGKTLQKKPRGRPRKQA